MTARAVTGNETVKHGVFQRILCIVSPKARENVEILEKTIDQNQSLIQSYSDMSQEIRKTVDDNHFSKHLLYIKQTASEDADR